MKRACRIGILQIEENCNFFPLIDEGEQEREAIVRNLISPPPSPPLSNGQSSHHHLKQVQVNTLKDEERARNP